MGQPVCDATLDISPGGHAGLRLAAVCGLTLLAIAVFSVAVIGVSQSRGTLALPPTYDDVVYLLDAASRLRVLKEGGLIGFLADYTSNPPHAPLWTLLAMLGLASSAAPVSASIAAAALLLVPFAMFHWAARGLPLHLALLLSLALLGMPLASMLVLSFRPDAACALFTCLGTLIVILRSWPLCRRDVLLAGAFYGAALLAKPTVFHLTTLLFAAGLGLGALNAVLWERTRIIDALRSAGLVLGLGILICLPHYVFGFGNTLNYIYTNIFGQEAPLWALQAPLRTHLLYYLTGQGGRSATGGWLYVAPLAGFAAIWLMLASHQYALARRAGLVFLLTAFCYAIVTAPPTKSPFIGISFSAYLACAIALGAVYLVSRAHSASPAFALGICATLIAFSGATYRAPTLGFSQRHVIHKDYVDSRHSMLQQAAAAVDRETLAQTTVLQAAISPYMNLTTLSYELAAQGRPVPKSIDFHRVDNIDLFRGTLEKTGVVIALSPEGTEVFQWLPSAKWRHEALQVVRQDGRFRLVRTIPDPYFGGEVYIFERKGTL